jgi:hypothetical protein
LLGGDVVGRAGVVFCLQRRKMRTDTRHVTLCHDPHPLHYPIHNRTTKEKSVGEPREGGCAQEAAAWKGCVLYLVMFAQLKVVRRDSGFKLGWEAARLWAAWDLSNGTACKENL